MTEDEILSELTDIMRDVFDDDSLVARPELTANDVDGWDSLNHVRLVLTTERKFKIKLAAAEVTSLKTLGDFVQLIKTKCS